MKISNTDEATIKICMRDRIKSDTTKLEINNCKWCGQRDTHE